MKKISSILLIFVSVFFNISCGRSPMKPPKPSHHPEPPQPKPEICDGLDNDLDGKIDEDFRDEIGRYIDMENCGSCGQSCSGAVPHAVQTACEVVSSVPACVALNCQQGYSLTSEGRCVRTDLRFCLPCFDDDGCGGFEEAICADIGGEKRCTVKCTSSSSCPSGTICENSICIPPGNSCTCVDSDTFDISCNILTPEGENCLGVAHCVNGNLGECSGRDEICDELDNDCDGKIDEDFKDSLGAYSIDDHNCGRCGVDCTRSVVPEGSLVCGGDPYHPICHLLCPDTTDGIQIGDYVDADLIIGTGCECMVSSLTDEPGPEKTSGENLDRNCDGADGNAKQSIYVAPDGDDSHPGSFMYPLASISAAIEKAIESLSTENPRPDIYIAAGTYFETINLPDGISLHGGYRKDFLSLDSESFLTVVIAPDYSLAPGGAALVIENGGENRAVVEGIKFVGAPPTATAQPSYGIYIQSPGPNLSIRNLVVESSDTLPGINGRNGRAGSIPSVMARDGEPPRAAVEDSFHNCITGDLNNTVAGGEGGHNTCGGIDVSGGRGGSASCPTFGSYQSAGFSGYSPSPSTPGGAGGSGGWDCEGPVTSGPCPTWICCGLADFTVPLEYQLAGDGLNGASGTPGSAGSGCNDPLGTISGGLWIPVRATQGTSGNPGAGGGGGGAGGGAVMTWYPVDCPWPDGLGGGGGGGGAGGCGGEGGTEGTSAAPSVGIMVYYEWSASPPSVAPFPEFENVTIITGNGGKGGRGGAGGDGGEGGLGGAGGDLPLEQRTTPPLAGPTRGGHGGKGGNGGPGGGGGGGCGGSTAGVWVVLSGAGDPGISQSLTNNCTFNIGTPGEGGKGGGGAVPGGNGINGVRQNVVIQ